MYETNNGTSHRACGHRFSVSAKTLDRSVWEKVAAVLTDPMIVAKELAALRAADPTKHDLGACDRALADVIRRRTNRARSLAILDDDEAQALVAVEISTLAARTAELVADRDNLLRRREAWEAAQERLANLEAWCRAVGRNAHTLSYEDRRELLTALDARVTLFDPGHEPRWIIQFDLAGIMAEPASHTPGKTSPSPASSPRTPHKNDQHSFVYRTRGRTSRRPSARRSAGIGR
jgi:hypothetical protein